MIDIEAAFEEHFSYVYLYIRKLSHNEAIAEEITSETFFKALSAIDSFREDCDIRVWLCQIAKNCYFTHVKKLQREQPLESSDADVPDSLLSGPCFQRKPLRKYSGRSMGWMNRTRRSLCGGHLES